MHGDALCTDDVAYQRLRRIVRNPVVRWAFRHMSLARRRSLAERMRAGSRMHVTDTPPEAREPAPAGLGKAGVSAPLPGVGAWRF